MQGDTGVQGKGPPEFLGQLKAKTAGFTGEILTCNYNYGAIAEIQDYPGQGFVHGHKGMTIAKNAFLVAQGLGKGLSQADPHIFHCMMLIHLQISPGLDRKIKKTVKTHMGEHMVKKTQASINIQPALTIQCEINLYFGFLGVALNKRRSPHEKSPPKACAKPASLFLKK
jgi:hypothetical protein